MTQTKSIKPFTMIFAASMIIAALLLTLARPAAAATTSSSNVTLPTTSGSDVVLSLVNQNPDPASAGDPVEVRIGVQNKGQDAKQNLVVELIPSYPFTALSGSDLVQTISTLGYQVDQNILIMKFSMGVDPQASAGTYNLKVWTYTVGNRNTHTEATIPVTVENQKNVQVIYVDKALIVPGQVTPLTFTINNVGKSSLNHVQFRWSTANNIILPANGAADRYVDSLSPGGSVNITYDVIASTNANPDLYGLNLVLSYDNPISGGQTNFTTVAGVYVGGGTTFAVSFDSSNTGATSFNIANTGSNPASAVAVSIPNQTGWRVTGSKTAVIGSLAKGDYTIASFNLAGVGRQPLKVEVDYTDTMGNRQTESYDVDVNAAPAGNATTFVRTGAGAGAAGGAGRAPATSITTVLLEAVLAIIVIGGIVVGIYRYNKKHPKKK